jgi:hypothetical protein
MSPKEYKDTVAELNGSQTNRVFEFFKVAAPERIGFAKHREAAEMKAAALAATDADAGETATSPRAAPMKKTSRKTAPAAVATAAAEGKARKKRGGRPVDSPPAAKRTQVVDVETGIVGTVIAIGCTFGRGWQGSWRVATSAAEPKGQRQQRRQRCSHRIFCR